MGYPEKGGAATKFYRPKEHDIPLSKAPHSVIGGAKRGGSRATVRKDSASKKRTLRKIDKTHRAIHSRIKRDDPVTDAGVGEGKGAENAPSFGELY